MTRKLLFVLIVVSMLMAACSAPAPSTPAAPAAAQPAQAAQTAGSSGFGSTLKSTLARGTVKCGVNTTSPGFSYVDPNGKYSGMEVDLCRALAAMIFGDPEKVEFIATTNENRFTTLQNGEHDVLIRSTTFTFTRNTELGLMFTVPYLHDGQGFEVQKDTKVESLKDLAGLTICINRGSTSELNLADVMTANSLEYEQVLYDNANDMYAAFEQGRCDAISTDKSSLISERGLLKNPDNFVITNITISKEPLAAVVRNGDEQWYNIVNWAFFGLFAAEEHGITQANVADMKTNSKDAEVRRMLGVEGDMGKKLGLSNDFMFNMIKAEGNYGEIFDRYFGPNTPNPMARGVDDLWTKGGLLYAPPIR